MLEPMPRAGIVDFYNYFLNGYEAKPSSYRRISR